MKTPLRFVTIGLLLLGTLTATAFFDPTIGRWASRDRIGENGGDNLYAFANNTPSRKIDILGLITFHETAVAKGLISYSCNCGWLDWTHFGFGAGMVREIDGRVNDYESDRSLDTFTIQRTGPKSILGARGTYQFVYEPRLDRRSRVLLDLDLMMQLSVLYETAQYNFAFNIAGGFSVEDLPSNYIGALEELNKLIPGSTGIDRERVNQLCHVLSTEDSLRMYNFGTGPRENRSHIPQLWSWRGWRLKTSVGGTMGGVSSIVEDHCDPCAKAKRQIPEFFSAFPTNKGAGLYRVVDQKGWVWW